MWAPGKKQAYKGIARRTIEEQMKALERGKSFCLISKKWFCVVLVVLYFLLAFLCGVFVPGLQFHSRKGGIIWFFSFLRILKFCEFC